MKKISILFAAAAMAIAFASCSNLNSTPEFTDDMSFVAFDNLSMSVAEDGKSVRIPITMASIDPAAVSVAYSVVDSEGNLAKEGKNFKFKDNSGVVVFDGKERSSFIDIEIIDNPGVFTGDIKFQIELVSAGELNIGFNKTCTVTITDNDHPLSDILGWYAATAGNGKAWDMELRKDPDDVSVVWFYNIGPSPVLLARSPSTSIPAPRLSCSTCLTLRVKATSLKVISCSRSQTMARSSPSRRTESISSSPVQAM